MLKFNYGQSEPDHFGNQVSIIIGMNSDNENLGN
jgi:hypothetical protein